MDKFTHLGAAVADLEAAWRDRLKDAEILLKAKRSGAAIADGIYALEIRLKVLVCKRLDLSALPRVFEIHDLDALLLLAGLKNRMEAADVEQDHWNAIKDLARQLQQLRYTENKKWALTLARTFWHQLTDPTEGVMTWLSKQK